MTVEMVVQQFGVTARTLHYYEQMGLIVPAARTEGGHRLYDQGNIERLEQILRLKENLGYSLHDIKQILEAEQSTAHLLQTLHSFNPSHPELRDALDKYITLLSHMVAKMENKATRLQAMRDLYKDRLSQARRLRDDLALTGFSSSYIEGE